jgi:hypothetical protein
VQGTAALDAGLYPVILDAATTLTVTTADPSNPRIDNVCLTLVDNGNNTSTFVVQIQPGTPASSPLAPTLPGNSLLLATIAVGAGVTSIVAGNITDQRLFTAASGGILHVASSATYPASGPESQYIHDAPLTAPFAAVTAQSTAVVTCTSNTVKQLVVQANVTVDGATKVKITASWPYLVANTASLGDEVMILLYRDSTQIKEVLQFRAQTANTNMDGSALSVTETPATGTHTYSLYMLNFGPGKSFSMFGASGSPVDLTIEPMAA